MTSSDILTLVRQIAPDLMQLDSSLLNFIDRANKRLVKSTLFPDAWVSLLTVANQQEYMSPELYQVKNVYVAGQIATQSDIATLQGNQIGLYSQVPNPTFPFVVPVAATEILTISGTITPGDVLITNIGGVPVAYAVQFSDTTLTILATSVASAVTTDLLGVTASGIAATPGKLSITAVAPGSAGNAITISTSVSGGATETYVAASPSLLGGTDGSGGAPGTLGPYAPSWAVQEPATYPVQNHWVNAIRPDAQPWGVSSFQAPRYYWRGGKIAVVPNVSQAGIEISIDCVRMPTTITTLDQIMTSPDMYADCIAWDVISMAYFSAADQKSIALSQAASNERAKCFKEIQLWRGTWQGEAPSPPRYQTQRFRMGLTGRGRFCKR
jgi:hypothetical protein